MLIKSLFAFIFIPFLLVAQVGIGTDTPHDSSILHLQSNNTGILIPRVDLVDTDASLGPIPSPANGLLVFNTNPSIVNGYGRGFYFYDNSLWRPINFRFNSLDQAYDGNNSGNGRTITADAGAVTIAGEDGLLVTGTFGTGAGAGSLGAGVRLMFNPNKAIFRAGYVDGAQWDVTNMANYSAAFGINNTASGARSFAANNGNTANGVNATAFGRQNISNGNSTFTTGVGNTATGLNAFTMGNDNVAIGDHSFVQGTYNTAGSNNEVVLGAFASNYTVSSATTRDLNDRMFAVGIGAGNLSRKSGLEVWKDGRVIIGDGVQSYVLPTTRGNDGAVLTSDGAGNTAFVAPEKAISFLPLNSDLTSTSITPASPADVAGYEVPMIPVIYDTAGEVQIKLVIDYTSLTGDVEFRLQAVDAMGTNSALSYNQFNGTAMATSPATFNTISSGGGIIETDWIGWNAGVAPQRLILQAQFTSSGGSDEITIKSAYLLVRGR